MSTHRGKVKFFEARKQWGMIVPDGTSPDDRTTNVFFGRRSLPYNVAGIDEGARVEYEVTRDQLGRPSAKNVRLVNE
jgi:cold shock CspA family protein